MKNITTIWPTQKPKIIHNFLNTGINLLEEKIGALSQNPKNPLSRICVANSCISLEPVRGCPFQCLYCVAGNDCKNLLIDKQHYHISYKRIRIQNLFPTKVEVLFPGKVLVDALLKHPGFIENKTIIGIMAGSSEAFLPIAEKETWNIMKRLCDYKLLNPIWIVTKFGIPDDQLNVWEKRFRYLREHDIRVIISISDANAPLWLEPYQRDRFKNFKKLKNAGVYFSHHLRPIIPDVNDSKESLEEALDRSLGFVKSVCIGGLRIDPAIKLRWKYKKANCNNISTNYKRLITGNPVGKVFSPKVYQLAKNVIREKGYNIPLYIHSSQMLSAALGIGDFNLYRYRKSDDSIFLSVPLEVQKKISKKYREDLLELLKKIARSIKLYNIQFIIDGKNIYVKNKINYQEHRLLIHAIGYSGIFNSLL